MLLIRKTTLEDLDAVMAIFERARRFMAETGNLSQWSGGYPPRSLIEDDVSKGNSYVVTQGESIAGTFFFAAAADPVYRVIRDGAWLDNGPYGVIHRIASSGAVKGVLAACVGWCGERCDSIRIDTHRDNAVMQSALGQLGFWRCGLVLLENGDERIAYQRV